MLGSFLPEEAFYIDITSTTFFTDSLFIFLLIGIPYMEPRHYGGVFVLQQTAESVALGGYLFYNCFFSFPFLYLLNTISVATRLHRHISVHETV